jgi:hypothetical protein
MIVMSVSCLRRARGRSGSSRPSPLRILTIDHETRKTGCAVLSQLCEVARARCRSSRRTEGDSCCESRRHCGDLAMIVAFLHDPTDARHRSGSKTHRQHRSTTSVSHGRSDDARRGGSHRAIESAPMATATPNCRYGRMASRVLQQTSGMSKGNARLPLRYPARPTRAPGQPSRRSAALR